MSGTTTVKTLHLQGPALDWIVARIEFPKGAYGGEADHYSGNNNERWIRIPDKENRSYTLANYSTNWAQGGPIFEREIASHSTDDNSPTKYAWHKNGESRSYGPTLLVAAMRCYVESQLGPEVELPDVFLPYCHQPAKPKGPAL